MSVGKNVYLNRSPLYVIAWRLVWIGPIYITRAVFVVLVSIAYGLKTGLRAWSDTE